MRCLLAITILVTVIVGCSDNMKMDFKSHDELLNSGYLENGWIPSDFPQNTKDINETHDIDVNKVWIESSFTGSFEFGGRELIPLDKAEIKNHIIKQFKLKNKTIKYYSISDKEYVAVDESNQKFYYYRNRY